MKHIICLLLFLVTFFCAAYGNDSLESTLSNLGQTLQQLESILKGSAPTTKIGVTQVDDTTYKVGDKTIKLVLGDITQQKNIDVLVNAANVGVTTVGTGGIARAIGNKMTETERSLFRKDILARYNITLGEVGGAYIGRLQKGSYLNKLGYTYLVNAVGPDCGAGEDVNLVADAYRNSLQEAAKLEVKSIILPRISAIIFGCPAKEVDRLAVDAVVNYLIKNPTSPITTVYLIFFPGQEKDLTALDNYKKLLYQRTR